MAWEIVLVEEFEAWIKSLERAQSTRINAHIALLAEYGPNLGRPHVDVFKGAKIGNLKELRVQISGDPWRILFAFDPARRAILLVGGNKRGDARWYEVNIPIAEKRLARHLTR